MDSSNQPKLAKVEKIIGRTGSRGGVIQVCNLDRVNPLTSFNRRSVLFSPILMDNVSDLLSEMLRDPFVSEISSHSWRLREKPRRCDRNNKS